MKTTALSSVICLVKAVNEGLSAVVENLFSREEKSKKKILLLKLPLFYIFKIIYLFSYLINPEKHFLA